MIQNILELIRNHEIRAARAALAECNEVDLAEAIEELEPAESLLLFRLLPKDMAAEVFSHLSRDVQQWIVHQVTDQELREIMNDLFLDDTVDMIEEMPANIVKRLLASTDRETRALINRFLQYPDDSAGSIMTFEFVDLRKSMTVRQAFDHIRQTGVDRETIYTGYVTDDARRLEGVVSIRTLLLSEPDRLVGEVMDTHVVRAGTQDDQEEIARLFERYDLLSVPVVDNEERLVGIITVDDVLDVIQEENTEDFEKMAALLPSTEDYLDAGILSQARRRLPWLMFLMVSAIFTGAIISFFEDSLAVMPALVAFIPMLMGTGGNSGSQAATLVIRGLALNQIRFSDAMRILWKEFRIAFVVGMLLAGVNIVRVYLFNHSLLLAVTVGLSMYVTIVLAKLVGGMLPLVASKFKLDPAIMAAPLISTLVDAGSLVCFFLLARLILNI